MSARDRPRPEAARDNAGDPPVDGDRERERERGLPEDGLDGDRDLPEGERDVLRIPPGSSCLPYGQQALLVRSMRPLRRPVLILKRSSCIGVAGNGARAAFFVCFRARFL